MAVMMAVIMAVAMALEGVGLAVISGASQRIVCGVCASIGMHC